MHMPQNIEQNLGQNGRFHLVNLPGQLQRQLIYPFDDPLLHRHLHIFPTYRTHRDPVSIDPGDSPEAKACLHIPECRTHTASCPGSNTYRLFAEHTLLGSMYHKTISIMIQKRLHGSCHMQDMNRRSKYQKIRRIDHTGHTLHIHQIIRTFLLAVRNTYGASSAELRHIFGKK